MIIISAQELEQFRKKHANIVLVLLAVWIIAFAVSLYLVIGQGMDPVVLIISWIIGFFTVAIVYLSFSSRYSAKYKETFARKLLTDTFDSVTYDPNRGIPESEFKANGIFRHWDRYSSSDYISGKYKGVSFVQAYVSTEFESTSTDSNGNTTTSYSSIFTGRWMIFDYNKSFCSTVKVLERYLGDGAIYNFTSSDGYEKISLENAAFNKKFHILSTSQHDAFYLLTPQTMEALLKLESQQRGLIVFFFKDSKLQVGLNNHQESFSPGNFGLFKKIDEEQIREKMFKDIQLIMDFADSLRLYSDLFKNTSSTN